MLRFKDLQGAKFTGKTYAEVVRSMRRASWTVKGKRQYMRQVARRLRVLGTNGVATDTCTNFIKSLVTTGWLQPAER